MDRNALILRTELINAFGVCNDHKSALRVFGSIPRRRVDVASVFAAMQCLIRCGRPKKAMSLHRGFDGIVEHNDRTNTLFVKAAIDGGAHRSCHEALSAMLRCNDERRHSVEFMNTVIAFYGKCGDVEAAQRVFDGMAGHKKDVRSVNAMMSALNHCGRHRAALALFDATATTLRDEYTECIALNAVAAMPGDAASMERAQRIFEGMSGRNKVDIASVGAMMQCLIRRRRFRSAIALHDECGLSPNDRTMTLYLVACGEAGDYGRGQIAVRWLRRNAKGHRPEVMNAVIEFLGKSGDVEAAAAIFSDAVSGGKADVVSVNAMMAALCGNGQSERALALFHDAVDGVVGGVVPNEWTFCVALRCCADLVAFDRGNAIVDRLEKEGRRHVLEHLHFECALISFLGKCGHSDRALALFERKRDEAAARNDRDGTASLYIAIMDCYAKIGDARRVLMYFERLKAEGPAAIGNAVYVVVLTACSQSGMVDEALSIWHRVQSTSGGDPVHPHIINAVIDCLSRANRLDEAERIYHDVRRQIHHRFRLSMLSSMWSSCRTHSDTERAQSIQAKMQRIRRRHNLESD